LIYKIEIGSKESDNLILIISIFAKLQKL